MNTQTIHEDTTNIRAAATTDLKLEVVVIPVSDVESRQALLREPGLAAGRRLRER